ncbi:MAG: T9SS type A sorting domain-containing protein [Lacinutrix sp.]|uniref:T9SS type A sorting domain-containing protein n=1 Tax=Lacinutrix sp. TaxID=1937692 RepID=UPI0030A19A71
MGDFSERFEIVFTNNTLSVDSYETISNNLSIIELQNNNVKFTYKGDSTIKSIKIIDVLGRELYNFKGTKKVEIFNLSNLSSAAYIAQIELSNDKLISKKALKN